MKKKCKLNMALISKGIVQIEFIMAVFVFLGSISFTTLAIGREFFSIREASISDTSKLRDAAISQILMFDKGFPDGWDALPIENVRRLGLSSDSKFVLNLNKVNRLQTLCNRANPDYSKNYNKIKELLGITGDIILVVEATDGTQFLNCRPAVETLQRPEFPVVAYAVIFQGSNAKIVSFRTVLVI